MKTSKEFNPAASLLRYEISKLKDEPKNCLQLFELVEKLQNQGNTFDFSEQKKKLKAIIYAD